MEILIVCGDEVNASKTANELKRIHVGVIYPRNITIHSTEEKSAFETALTIRRIIVNKVLYKHPSLVNKAGNLFEKNNEKERDILVTNSDEIKRILKLAKDKHGINFDRRKKIEKGSIISVPINNGNKIAEKIFTL